mmetsp:Transcript_28215/g.91184  ORF Transcript_28215/g.91184 Transcript_28215/m.91184 type:complete len:255 (+) Transcript_28215:1499-2263(+)
MDGWIDAWVKDGDVQGHVAAHEAVAVMDRCSVGEHRCPLEMDAPLCSCCLAVSSGDLAPVLLLLLLYCTLALLGPTAACTNGTGSVPCDQIWAAGSDRSYLPITHSACATSMGQAVEEVRQCERFDECIVVLTVAASMRRFQALEPHPLLSSPCCHSDQGMGDVHIDGDEVGGSFRDGENGKPLRQAAAPAHASPFASSGSRHIMHKRIVVVVLVLVLVGIDVGVADGMCWSGRSCRGRPRLENLVAQVEAMGP